MATNLVVVKTQLGPQGPPGSAIGVAGTGFLHYTGGVADTPARAVNLATADVTGVLPLAEQAAPTGTGFVTVTAGAWDAAATAYPIGFAKGGTGVTTLAAGVVTSNGSILTSAGLGAGLQVLRTNAGATAVEWATPNAGTITGIASTGAGTGVVANGVSGANVQVKSLIAGANVTITNNLNDITIAATASTPPTGTGFVTVTAGVQDAAALAFPLAIAKGGTNAASFATSGGVTRYNGTSLVNSANFTEDGSGNATLATSLAIGGAGATAGYLRFPYNGASAVTVLGVKDSTSVQRAFITYGSGDAWTVGNTSQDLSEKFKTNYSIDNGTVAALVSNGTNVYLGMNSSFTAMHSNVEIYPSATIAMGINGADYFQVNGIDGTLKGAVPFVGESAANSPYGVHGAIGINAPAGGTITLSSSQYCYQIIAFGGLGGVGGTGGTVVFPQPADNAHAYWKWIINGTTGNLIVSVGAGTTVTIATTKAAAVYFVNGGVGRLTPDT